MTKEHKQTHQKSIASACDRFLARLILVAMVYAVAIFLVSQIFSAVSPIRIVSARLLVIGSGDEAIHRLSFLETGFGFQREKILGEMAPSGLTESQLNLLPQVSIGEGSAIATYIREHPKGSAMIDRAGFPVPFFKASTFHRYHSGIVMSSDMPHTLPTWMTPVSVRGDFRRVLITPLWIRWIAASFICAAVTMPVLILCATLYRRMRGRGPTDCVTCGYSLVGLQAHRCPECGSKLLNRSAGSGGAQPQKRNAGGGESHRARA